MTETPEAQRLETAKNILWPKQAVGWGMKLRGADYLKAQLERAVKRLEAHDTEVEKRARIAEAWNIHGLLHFNKSCGIELVEKRIAELEKEKKV